MSIERVYEALYEHWLRKNHPYAPAILGWVAIIELVCFLVSCFLPIWFDFWWKVMLASGGSFIITFVVARFLKYYWINQFLNQ